MCILHVLNLIRPTIEIEQLVTRYYDILKSVFKHEVNNWIWDLTWLLFEKSLNSDIFSNLSYLCIV